MAYLGLVDVAGIQNFLFRKPELKEIAAASGRVEALGSAGGLFHSTPAECLLAAGGNAALRASDAATLQQAFQQISRSLLDEGDGLQVAVCIEPYADGELPSAYLRALKRLEQRKLTQPRDTEFVFSGLTPAEPYPQVNRPTVPGTRRPGLPEPTQLADLICGSTEQTDLMAVVSVDGLAMGRRLNRWLQSWIERSADVDSASDHPGKTAFDQSFLNEFYAWSEFLKHRWQDAWEATLDDIEASFLSASGYVLQHTGLSNRALWLRQRPGQPPFLPCRRIYQGGDDLNFVCDARVALSVTASLLRHLRDLPAGEAIPSSFRSVSASAGVVFVNTHFPFARAVALADQVRQNAKRKAIADDYENPSPTLDWWLNRNGALTRPELLFSGASLKPYPLDSSAALFAWERLDRGVLPGFWEIFGTSRNKLKDILEAAEEGDGGVSVQRLLHLRPLRDAEDRPLTKPFSWAAPLSSETGFNANRETVLLDAGELYDIHFPFPAGGGGGGLTQEAMG